MASLNAIARAEGDTIRDGIAWLIVWKTGRSWNAERVSLNPADNTFDPDDLAMARKVLAQDPNAVMLNGYYCGGFGEDMTTSNIEAGIRWHYGNGYNLLRDVQALFLPEDVEQMKTPEELDLGTIYIDGEAFNGEITELDMNAVGDSDIPETIPPINEPVELELTITPDVASALMDQMHEVTKRFREIFSRIADGIIEWGKQLAAILRKALNGLMDAMLDSANTHPEWWHRYKHSKKLRTRKKYQKLLMQQLLSRWKSNGMEASG